MQEAILGGRRKTHHKRRISKNITRRHNYDYSLTANNYISTSFHTMMVNTNKEEQLDYLYYLIRYCFPDITLVKSKEIAINLYEYIIDFKTDHEICDLMYTLYKSITKKDILGFPVTSEEYVKIKVQEIETVITPTLFKRTAGKVLVDVGAGDCAISKLLGEYNNMKSIAIDIKSDIDWGSASSASVCDSITHIYYNGDNLIEAVRRKIHDKKVGIIMYNHSLHHFGSVENIKKSLKQAYKLLSKGGILVLREHDKNKTNDININLQHILLSIRYTIDHYNTWDKDQIWKYTDNYIKTYTSHYLSRSAFINICKSCGFKLIQTQPRIIPNKWYKNYKEISMTTLFAFIK